MIARWVKNELTLRRIKRFKSIRRALWSVWIIVFLLFLSVSAEFWANSKPLLLHFNGSLYAPIVTDYHPSVFAQEGFVTNYRALDMKADGNWAIWPLVKWNPY